jgi:L-rhamnose mutarotase
MRYCFALDLIDDEKKIAEYESHHAVVWPEVEDSFRRAGIEHVELYRAGNRLFMLLDVNESFSFEKKAEIDASDPVVRKWEALMSTYQRELPWAKEGEKWMLMKLVYRSAL